MDLYICAILQVTSNWPCWSDKETYVKSLSLTWSQKANVEFKVSNGPTEVENISEKNQSYLLDRVCFFFIGMCLTFKLSFLFNSLTHYFVTHHKH